MLRLVDNAAVQSGTDLALIPILIHAIKRFHASEATGLWSKDTELQRMRAFA
jgi:hypothetical protein